MKQLDQEEEADQEAEEKADQEGEKEEEVEQSYLCMFLFMNDIINVTVPALFISKNTSF